MRTPYSTQWLQGSICSVPCNSMMQQAFLVKTCLFMCEPWRNHSNDRIAPDVQYTGSETIPRWKAHFNVSAGRSVTPG
jgi:hypothetical protein